MQSLRFEQAEARQATIVPAHFKTCEWLLIESEYRDWLDSSKISDHNGFLRIVGKPGTGKSTIMKFLLSKHKRASKEGTICISFFFNARGEELERSPEGLYRSLLYQMLEKVPDLRTVFGSMISLPKSTDNGKMWHLEVLQRMFHLAIEHLDQTQLVCFIDALDECPEDQIRDMIRSFENHGDLAISARTRLHVCFASRHYPHITINRGLQVVLENQVGHSKDIARYLSNKLKAGQSQQAEQIRAEILEKASGIFLWAVLVVDILNKEYDHGRLHALRDRLREIPAKLSDLFKDILTRDNEHMSELMLCIQWILFAKRPLELGELYFAILSGLKDKSSLEWDPQEITPEIMKRFIISSSKGLAQLTKSGKAKVQLIHESVNDFLLKEQGLATLWPNSDASFESLSHESLRDCCDNYLDVRGISECLNDSTQLQKAMIARNTLSEKFPFLEYAVHNVLYHANAAEENGLSQETFIQKFDLKRWIPVKNSFQIYGIRRYTANPSFLYICADIGLPSLAGAELKRQAKNDGSSLIPSTLRAIAIRPENERHRSPLLAALVNRREKTAMVLFGLGKDKRPDDKDNSDTRFHLDDQLISDLQRAQEKSSKWDGSDVLSYLARRGALSLVKLLLSCPNINLNGRGESAPLRLAASNGYRAIVELLVEKGADIKSKNEFGVTPLMRAVEMGHEATVTLLVEKGADIESKNIYGQTALTYAALSRLENMVKLLVEKGADIESKDRDGQTPLTRAVLRDFYNMVKLLIEKGADINSKDHRGQTPLHYAAAKGHEAIVKLLDEWKSRTGPQQLTPQQSPTDPANITREDFEMMDIRTMVCRSTDGTETSSNGGQDVIASKRLSTEPALWKAWLRLSAWRN